MLKQNERFVHLLNNLVYCFIFRPLNSPVCVSLFLPFEAYLISNRPHFLWVYRDNKPWVFNQLERAYYLSYFIKSDIQ